jgi:AsmA-like protein
MTSRPPKTEDLRSLSDSPAVASTTPYMAEETPQSAPTHSRWKRRVTIIALLAVLIAAAVVLPPLINVSSYQRQITALISRSLGRPVRLSNVKLRLLPRPGFILQDLSVGEDPEFGVEPILSAQTVVASIRLGSLWRGHLEIDRISLDEASLNLVQSQRGRWNLESIMMGSLVKGMNSTAPTTAPRPAFSRRPAAFPYLEATNSRVNLKRGFEKSPYSLLGTQLSFWQESPGIWRLRLRGQPARTDMEISAADTGELRAEGTLQTLPGHELRQMPIKLQAEWREAQLGQLTRLLLGSDEGWRGDLTADLDVQGTADAAQTRARLRATGVRRAEFAPAVPLDFDINCSLLYQHSEEALRNVGCDTAIGDGKLHLKADLPGNSGHPEAELAVDALPLQAGLDLLRSLRSGFAPGVAAEGKVSGMLSLTPPQPAVPAHSHPRKPASSQAEPTGTALQGSLTVTGGVLRGGSLSQSLTLPKIVLTPSQIPDPAHANPPVPTLTSKFTVALGAFPAAPAASRPVASAQSETAASKASSSSAQAPPPPAPSTGPASATRMQELTVRLVLAATGYQSTFVGTAAPTRLRELAYAFGVPHSSAADSVSSGIADLDLTAYGPWIPSPDLSFTQTPPVKVNPSSPSPVLAGSISAGFDQLSGSMQLHRVVWSAPYLAGPVEIPEAAVALSGSSVAVTGAFVYGPVKGSATATNLGACDKPGCLPLLQIRLGAADAAAIEAALLGAPEKKSLLSPLIDRMRNSDTPKWPPSALDVEADSLVLGPVTLHKPSLQLKMSPSEITLQSWQAGVLGGSVKGSGSCAWSGKTFKYDLTGEFHSLSGAALGALTVTAQPVAADAQNPDSKVTESNAAEPNSAAAESGPKNVEAPVPPSTFIPWSGGPVDGSGKIEISGLTGKDLASSATGSLQFHWLKGSIPVAAAAKTPVPSSMRFDDWTGEAAIAAGRIELKSNTLRQGQHKSSLSGTIPFTDAPHLTAAPAIPQPAAASKPSPKQAAQ